MLTAEIDRLRKLVDVVQIQTAEETLWACGHTYQRGSTTLC